MQWLGRRTRDWEVVSVDFRPFHFHLMTLDNLAESNAAYRRV